MELISSSFLIKHHHAKFVVTFLDKEKKWLINAVDENSNISPTLKEYQGNGVKNYPNADDADTILAEFLELED